MNRADVEELVAKNRVVALKADKTHENPEIDGFLKELGNAGAVIPFLAIFPGDGQDPLTFDGPLTQQMVIDALQRAGPSQGSARKKVADATPIDSSQSR